MGEANGSSAVGVITGAAHGIGEELAKQLSTRGLALVLVDSDAEALNGLCRRLPGPAEPFAGDVADPGFAQQLTEVLDGREVSIALSFAGVMHVGTVRASAIEQLQRTVSINLLGTMATVSAVLPGLSATGGIITASSAVEGLAVPGRAAYVASKAGVVGFTRVVAGELRTELPQATVSCAVIGGARTDIMKRALLAEGIDREANDRSFQTHVARHNPQWVAERILDRHRQGTEMIRVGADARLVEVATRLVGRYGRLPRRLSPTRRGGRQ